jgi:ABC-type enterochelin transport system permease subunit
LTRPTNKTPARIVKKILRIVVVLLIAEFERVSLFFQSADDRITFTASRIPRTLANLFAPLPDWRELIAG